MTKKKTEDIEDAEIVVSDNLKQDHKNSYQIKSQLIVLYVVVFTLFILLFCFFIYYQSKIIRDIQDLQAEINSMSPIVSLKTIENKLIDLETSARSESISRINEASRKIEVNLSDKLESLPDLKSAEDSLNLMKEDLAKLKVKFESNVSEMETLPNKNTEKPNIDVVSLVELEIALDSLKTNFDIKFDSLENRFNGLEQEFLLSDNKLINSKKVNLSHVGKSIDLDVNSLKKLKEEFPKLAHTALKMEIKGKGKGNLWSNFSSTLKSMFVFRSTVPRKGFDTDAILSRAEHKLTEGNFEGCLIELSYLDGNSAELFVDWKNNLQNLMNENN